MGQITQIVRVLAAATSLIVTGCSGGEDLPTPPPFAAAVPGNAILVTWGDAATRWLDDTGFGRQLTDGEDLVDGGDARYFVVPGAAETWPTLSTSMPFRRALLELPDHVAGGVFVDLQQLVEHGMGELLDEIPRTSPIVQSLGLEALQFLIAWTGPDGELRSVLRSTGRSTGVAALLTGPLGPSLLGDPAAGETRLELRVDPEVVARMIEALASDDVGMQGMMMGQMSQSLRTTLRRIQPHLGGRVSVVIPAEGSPIVACSVVDRSGLEAALTQFFGTVRDGGLKVMGGRYAHVEDHRIVLTDDDGEDPPAVGSRSLTGAFWLSVPDMDGLQVEVARRDPANLELAVRRDV